MKGESGKNPGIRKEKVITKEGMVKKIKLGVYYIVLTILALVFLAPLVWMISSSLKTSKHLFRYPPEWIPKMPVLIIKGDLEIPEAVFKYPYKEKIRKKNQELQDRLLRYRQRKPWVQELKIELEDGKTVLFKRWMVIKLKKNYLLLQDGDIYPPDEAEKLFALKKFVASGKGRLTIIDDGFDFVVKNAEFKIGRRIRLYWENYYDIFCELPAFYKFILNSVFLVVVNVVLTVFSSSMVAYSFARLKWPGRDVLFILLLSTMMIPGQVIMIPVFLIYRYLGWVNTLKPLWFGSLFGSAFYIFMLKQFFLTLPGELEEAAKIDGADPFTIFVEIMLPLVKPALITVAIWQFIGTWNDFMGPLIYIIDRVDKMPLSLGLHFLQSTHGGDFALLMAASTLATLPIIVVFFLAQKSLIKGFRLVGITK